MLSFALSKPAVVARSLFQKPSWTPAAAKALRCIHINHIEQSWDMFRWTYGVKNGGKKRQLERTSALRLEKPLNISSPWSFLSESENKSSSSRVRVVTQPSGHAMQTRPILCLFNLQQLSDCYPAASLWEAWQVRTSARIRRWRHGARLFQNKGTKL